MAHGLEGIHFMMPTPFDDHGRVDEDSIPGLVEFAVKAGCRGVVCLGVMGEFTKLDLAERLVVLKRVTATARGRIAVIVGATAGGTDLAIRRVAEAAEAGATAAMVSPPPISNQNLDAAFAFYQSLNRHTPLPIVVQDYPLESGLIMPAAFIARLCAELEHCRDLKLEDAPTPTKVTAVRKLVGDRMDIFGGLGGVFLLEELARGAVGTMTGFAYPEVLVRVHRLVTGGDLEGARRLFYRYVPLIRYEGQQGIGLALRKAALHRRGLLKNAKLRHPGPVLDQTTIDELYATMDAVGIQETAALP